MIKNELVMLNLCEENGETIFNIYTNSNTLPRIGETITYSMLAKDKDCWNKNSWDKRTQLSDKKFKVLDVVHDYRRHGVLDNESHVIFIKIREEKLPGDWFERANLISTLLLSLDKHKEHWDNIIPENIEKKFISARTQLSILESSLIQLANEDINHEKEAEKEE